MGERLITGAHACVGFYNPVERFVRDLRMYHILEGTSQIMRMVIGRKLIA